jgi:hypothetical protein
MTDEDFRLWLGPIINKVIQETACIHNHFLLYSQKTKQTYGRNHREISICREIVEHYRDLLKEDLDIIKSSADDEIHSIFKQFTLRLPYCGPMQAKEYLFVKSVEEKNSRGGLIYQIFHQTDGNSSIRIFLSSISKSFTYGN